MIKYFLLFQLVAVLFLIKFDSAEAHGYLFDPVARGSRWRFNDTAPTDYNDNEGFCGGFGVQFGQNGGKCGLCGNNYKDKTPRDHELGGIYGEGIIVKEYKSGSVIVVQVNLTANHMGYFKFSLCNLGENQNRETESCFKPLELNAGGFEYKLKYFQPATFQISLKLPEKMSCKHCVLRWTYNCGNSWGKCDDGSEGMGCGDQENFVGCSDIAIV